MAFFLHVLPPPHPHPPLTFYIIYRKFNRDMEIRQGNCWKQYVLIKTQRQELCRERNRGCVWFRHWPGSREIWVFFLNPPDPPE